MFKKIKISKKLLNLSICCALISAIVLSVADFDAKCEDLRKNVLRLHIIANSDNKSDQSVKLKVRDAILENSGEIFDGITDIETAVMLANQKIEEFNSIANKVLKENGFKYNATVKVDKTFFETREYDEFTLPAGIYDSLIITLGSGQGKNWWCVIFPEICLPTAKKGDLRKTVPNNSAKIATNSKQYVPKFKIVEIYQKIKNKIK